MIPMKKNYAGGVITFHTPFSVSSLKIQECTTDIKDNTDTTKGGLLSRVRSKSTSERVSSHKTDKPSSSSGPMMGPKGDWLSHTSHRQLQAKRKFKNEQGRETTNLETGNTLLKEFDVFLGQWDATQLKRKELLHQRWTERVWLPLQRRLEDHLSSFSLAEAKKQQILYSQFLQHCNLKGCVFLETYDAKEYNPFLLNIKNSYKLNIENIKDPLCVQPHERQMQKRIAPCQAGCKYTIRHVKKLPQSDRPFTEFGISQASTPPQVSFSYTASASRKTQKDDKTQGREQSRLDTIPYHVKAAATADGRCDCSTCTFSKCGCLQKTATLRLLQDLPTSK